MPFANVKTPEVPTLVRDGLRLQKPDECTDAIYSIMTSCWNVNPKLRPNFEAVVRSFAGQLAVHGLAPQRDIGATLFAEKGSTLMRNAQPFSPATVSLTSSPQGGLVRINSVSRKNPLFQGDGEEPSCSRCGLSFQNKDPLFIKSHKDSCHPASNLSRATSVPSTVGTPGASVTSAPSASKMLQQGLEGSKFADASSDMLLLQTALSSAHDDDDEESSTDAVHHLSRGSAQSSRENTSMRAEHPYINADPRQSIQGVGAGAAGGSEVLRSSSLTNTPPARSPGTAAPPVYVNAMPISRQNSAPGMVITPSNTAQPPPTAPKPSTPLSTPPAAAKPVQSSSPFANKGSSVHSPSSSSKTGSSSTSLTSAVGASSSGVVRSSSVPATASLTAVPVAGTLSSTSTPTSVSAVRPTPSEKPRKQAAPLDKLQLSGKAESALKVHSNEAIFSDSKVKHSKIFEALNPQPLAFQTARDRAEREDLEQLGTVGSRNYFDSFVASAPEMESFGGFEDGHEDEDEDEDAADYVEEIFDPNNLPDFGDFTEEMMKRRAERAAEEQRRRELLAKQFAEKKALEKAEMEKELEEIRKREAQEAAKKKIDDSFVVETQRRLESELSFGNFTFA